MAAAAPSSDKPERDAPAESRLTPAGPDRATVSRIKGDLPPSILDRYLIEHDGRGRAERFFRDHRADAPAFRDAGRALTAASAYPDVVADMLTIARHRGWTQVRVEGDPAFRREVWVQAQAMDIAVQGYRPTERDRQAGGARTTARDPDRPRPTERPFVPSPPLEARMRLAAAAVQTLVADPAARTRLLERAWARAAAHLERGHAFRPPPDLERSPTRDRPDADRRRKR
ncbi:LPD7 domain-containing protein [Brevundimonas sp.]|uniref:LPD7 domain-containing protein n=1 Tax=Brevundimonas sp. TaxID=1871086 RepID=UPI002489DECF|nr:LPD7 domain-containing protein [Brevundimonas sp.]MDI1281715.1 hypothetical protein [Brevundimonas sp.]